MSIFSECPCEGALMWQYAPIISCINISTVTLYHASVRRVCAALYYTCVVIYTHGAIVFHAASWMTRQKTFFSLLGRKLHETSTHFVLNLFVLIKSLDSLRQFKAWLWIWIQMYTWNWIENFKMQQLDGPCWITWQYIGSPQCVWCNFSIISQGIYNIIYALAVYNDRTLTYEF